MQPSWSETIYKVVKVQGQTILLDDGTKQKRYNLFKIPQTTQINYIKVHINTYLLYLVMSENKNLKLVLDVIQQN